MQDIRIYVYPIFFFSQIVHFTRVGNVERSRISSSTVENPVTSAPTRYPPIFLARRPVHAHAPAPLPTRRDKENASVYERVSRRVGHAWETGTVSSRGGRLDFSPEEKPPIFLSIGPRFLG